jgi:hypothetical protein
MFSLPLGTSEEFAEQLLQKIKREQGEGLNWLSIYWRLREVDLLDIEKAALNIYSVGYSDPSSAYSSTPIETIVSAYSKEQALELALKEEGWVVANEDFPSLACEETQKFLPDLLEVKELDIKEPQVFCHVRE